MYKETVIDYMFDRGGLEVLLRILAWGEDGEGERTECVAGGRQVRGCAVEESGEGERLEGEAGVWQVRVSVLCLLQVLLEGMHQSAEEREWVQLHSAMSASNCVKGVLECCNKAWLGENNSKAWLCGNGCRTVAHGVGASVGGMNLHGVGGMNLENQRVLWTGCRVLWLLSHSPHAACDGLVQAQVRTGMHR